MPLRRRLPDYMTGPTLHVLQSLGIDPDTADTDTVLAVLAYRVAARLERHQPDAPPGFRATTATWTAGRSTLVVLALAVPFDEEDDPRGNDLLDAVREAIRQQRHVQRFGRPAE